MLVRVLLIEAIYAATFVLSASNEEAAPSQLPERWFNDRVPYMISRYHFQDEQGNPWDENTYMQNVRRANQQVDHNHYYRHNWERLQESGIRVLESQGSLHPSMLAEHPAYSGWVAPKYGERGPMYHKKVAEIDPANPLGRDNPDIAVFAPAQHIHDYTKTQYQTLLYSIKRADRRYVPGRSERIGQYYIPEKAGPLPEGWSWSHQLASSSKMRSLDVLEQFGYDPRNLYKTIGIHDEQNDFQIYNDANARRRYLINAQAYLRQFDDDSAKTRFYQYAWTTVRTDDPQSVDVWYHTPIFDVYSNFHIKMMKYGPAGHQKPSLDRIRFVPERYGNGRGKVRLVPISIVRPMDVSQSRKEVMMFRTIKRFTSEERMSYAVSFQMLRPRLTNRDIPGRVRQRNDGRGVRFDLRNQDIGRPLGHPFSLYPYRPLTPDEYEPVNQDMSVSQQQTAEVRDVGTESGVASLLQQARQKKARQGIQVQGHSSGAGSVLSNLEQHLNPSSEAFRYKGRGGELHAPLRIGHSREPPKQSINVADPLMPDLERSVHMFAQIPHP